MSDTLPLTPRVFLILWALQHGPRHGYGLLGAIEERGRGQVTIGPASLYEAIQSLRKRRWIAATEAPAGADRRRRYFRLTDEGRGVLEAEAQRLADLVDDLRAEGLLQHGESQ